MLEIKLQGQVWVLVLIQLKHNLESHEDMQFL